MDIKTYNDSIVDIVDFTKYSAHILKNVLDLPMRGYCDFSNYAKSNNITVTERLKLAKRVQAVIAMEHNTVLEFIDFTFYIQGVSAKLLAQIRTHRMAVWMSASHHYTDANKFNLVFDKEPSIAVKSALAKLYAAFEKEKSVIGKDEARQYLPVASSYNILVKMNASSLLNFFKKRLCLRNSKEMYTTAMKMYNKCHKADPFLFQSFGPYCKLSKCNQGKMRCQKNYSEVYNETIKD